MSKPVQKTGDYFDGEPPSEEQLRRIIIKLTQTEMEAKRQMEIMKRKVVEQHDGAAVAMPP